MTNWTKAALQAGQGHSLSRGQERVLYALAAFADKTGRSWPGTSTIAEYTGLERRYVRRCLAMLVERGLVEVERRGGHGPHHKTGYRLLFAEAAPRKRGHQHAPLAAAAKRGAQGTPHNRPGPRRAWRGR